MKRLRYWLGILVLGTLLCTGAAAEEKDITVYINDSQLLFDTNPVLEDGRTLVPLRVIFESLGASVTWIDETRTAVAKKGDIEIQISIDNTQMLKNGEVVVLDVPARMVNDRTMVPARAVSEGMGAKVDWDDVLWRVLIQSPDIDRLIYPHTTLTPVGQHTIREVLPEYVKGFMDAGIPALMEGLPVKETISDGAPAILELTEKLWNNGISQLILAVQLESESRYDLDTPLLLTDEQIQADYRATGSKYGLSAKDHMHTSYAKDKSGTVLLLTFATGETKYLTVSFRDEKFVYQTAKDDAELERILNQ